MKKTQRKRLWDDKEKKQKLPCKTITDDDYADDIAILANAPTQAETLLHSFERAAVGIGPHVNVHETEYICFNQTGDISSLGGSSLKLIDKFTNLRCRVSSTEKDIDTQLTKAWTAINRLLVIWKSDPIDKMKRSFFQVALVSILLCRCTTRTLTKRMEKKLDGNYSRMLQAILNKSRRQHPSKQQLYGHLPSITKTIKIRRARHAEHCWRSGAISSLMFSYGPPHMAEQKQGDLLEPTYSSSMRIRDVALRICQKRWTIRRSGERGSGIFVLAARHEDDNDTGYVSLW